MAAGYNRAMSKPRIAITMGDAAGVGPEIVMKALAHRDLYDDCRPFVVGDAVRLGEAGFITRTPLSIRMIADVSEARFEPGAVDCLDLKLLPPGMPFGKISAAAGHAAMNMCAPPPNWRWQAGSRRWSRRPSTRKRCRLAGMIFPATLNCWRR